eukprot:984819_1
MAGNLHPRRIVNVCDIEKIYMHWTEGYFDDFPNFLPNHLNFSDSSKNYNLCHFLQTYLTELWLVLVKYRWKLLAKYKPGFAEFVLSLGRCPIQSFVFFSKDCQHSSVDFEYFRL